LAYRIIFMNDERELGEESMPDKESGVRCAMEKFEALKEQHGATSVVVIDQDTENVEFAYKGSG